MIFKNYQRIRSGIEDYTNVKTLTTDTIMFRLNLVHGNLSKVYISMDEV